MKTPDPCQTRVRRYLEELDPWPTYRAARPPIEPAHAAFLLIDTQNFGAHPDGGEFAGLGDGGQRERLAYYFDRVDTVAVPNLRRLQDACRAAGIEVLFTVIESLTRDGRDRSLDYKISGFHVPPGSWDAQVLDALVPCEDEIVLRKTSSSVFVSTNLDYLLRNLGVRQLIIGGFLTDQCVESAVRDACDLGYLVTLVPDACATVGADRQDASLRALSGYCRQRDTDTLIAEIRAVGA